LLGWFDLGMIIIIIMATSILKQHLAHAHVTLGRLALGTKPTAVVRLARCFGSPPRSQEERRPFHLLLCHAISREVDTPPHPPFPVLRSPLPVPLHLT
jgi:hypothetical protein